MIFRWMLNFEPLSVLTWNTMYLYKIDLYLIMIKNVNVFYDWYLEVLIDTCIYMITSEALYLGPCMSSLCMSLWRIPPPQYISNNSTIKKNNKPTINEDQFNLKPCISLKKNVNIRTQKHLPDCIECRRWNAKDLFESATAYADSSNYV